MRRPIHAPVFEGNISQVDNQIKQMQAQVKDCDARIKELGTELTTHLEQYTRRGIALQIAEQYNAEHNNREKYTNALVKLYQIQVQNVQHGGTHLNAEQQQQITKEMKKLEELSNKGYRTEKFWTDTDIPNDIFISFLDEITRTCLLIMSIVECLVVSNKQERNVHKTTQYKLLCASQSLAVLLNIQNSRAMNDFVLFFGMLCISYGAGKQFINMLSSLGLSLHWDTLYVLNLFNIFPKLNEISLIRPVSYINCLSMSGTCDIHKWSKKCYIHCSLS